MGRSVTQRLGGVGAMRRIARPFAFLVLLLALVAWSEMSAAIATEFMSAQEAELSRLLNGERAAKGLPTLSSSDALRTVARRHSQRMMTEGTIFHNQRLSEEVQALFPKWARVGENVGVGPSIPSVHRAFMNSPGHRANILDPDFAHLAVGVVSGGSRLFMTENFLKLQPGAVRPVPASFRLAGGSRTATARSIADFGFTPGTARGAVLAPSHDYHGALAGAALAGAIGGPTVLSGTASLDAEARAALERALGGDRGGKTVYLVGGPFTAAVRNAVAGLGVRVATIGGADHVATAAAVARSLPRRPTTAFVATVADYPDALAVSAVAAVHGWPVLYTDPRALSPGTAEVIRQLGINRSYVAGGPDAVSEAVAAQLRVVGAPMAQRLAGTSRIETATAVADFALGNGLNPRHVQIATAYNYPDALAGGPLAGVLRGPVLLTTHGGLHGTPGGWLRARRGDVDAVYLLGGPAALSGAVEPGVSAALQ
ncbi:MAG TPA: cell wall-binding repeat-containing protein [Nitriliruptorales bacterium]|nr:cell wall-binding repeat-containing protein [Nitriliruptorales bacterium]